MALDFQKSAYMPHRKRSTNRTTYGVMNKWRDFVVKPEDNPYEQGRRGEFGRLTPVLDIPLPGDEIQRECETTTKRRDLARENERQLQQGSDFTQALIKVTLADEQSRGVKRSTIKKHPRTSNCACPPPNRSRTGSQTHRDQTNENRDEISESLPVHLHYYKSSGYDDFHRSFLHLNKLDTTPTYPVMGPPRLRNGRVGGSWRHVKQVLQPRGDRILFIDGGPRVTDNSRILTNEIPAVDILQPLHKPSARQLFSKRVRAPAHEMEEYRATQGANWSVMR